MTYERGVAPLRGRRDWDSPLETVNIQLADNEYLVGARVNTGAFMDSLTFITNLQTYGPYGGPGGGLHSFDGRITGIIAAVQNFGGYALQAIGFFYL